MKPYIKKHERWLAFFVICLTIATVVGPVSAQGGAVGLELKADVGFDGFVKSNTWTPVRVVATNTGPDLIGEVRLQADYPGEVYIRPLTLPSQSQKEILLLVPLTSGDFTLSFAQDNKVIRFERYSPRLIATESFLIGILSTDPSLLNFLAGLQTTNLDPVEVAHLSLAELGEAPQSLAALDVLIFNDIDTSILTPAQRTNLVNWVTTGGHLVVGGGPNATTTAGGLQKLLPFSSVSRADLADLPALASFGSETIPNQGPYLAAVPQAPQGIALIEQASDTLLLSQPVGEGKVTYFALDFGLAPMNGWAGNEAFWQKTLAPLETTPPFYTTYEAGQSFNNALANIDVATLPSPWAMMTFLCLYMLILVPINYVVLAKLKRRELAWLTIPVLIIIFSLVGYVGGFRARGGQPLLRHIEVIQQPDMSQAEHLGASATLDTFIGLYSPSRNRYTLALADGFLAKPTDTGSSSNAIGQNSSAPTAVFYGGDTQLQNLRTDVGTMATAISHGQIAPTAIELNLQVEKINSSWQVMGTVENKTNQALEDVLFIIEDYGLQMDSLAPGITELDARLRRLDLTGSYNDTTLWGAYYYQTDDSTTVVKDQMIRALLWPNAYYGQVLPSLDSGADPHQITLLGWRTNATPLAKITVIDQRVDENTTQLFVIRDSLVQ